MKALNLTNQKFGRLTAISPEVFTSKRGWHCECSCGEKTWVPTFELTSGNKSSCGCKRDEAGDISGIRFGKLIAQKKHHRDSKNRRWAWECLCDCGNLKIAWIRNLQRGATIDCGCGLLQRRKFASDKRKLPEIQRIINSKLSDYKSNAKSSGREFSISLEDAERLFTSNCFYCGNPPSDTLSGIDRFNNDMGYIKENCVPCCKRCNYIKNKHHGDDIIKWANTVAKLHNGTRYHEEPST